MMMAVVTPAPLNSRPHSSHEATACCAHKGVLEEVLSHQQSPQLQWHVQFPASVHSGPLHCTALHAECNCSSADTCGHAPSRCSTPIHMASQYSWSIQGVRGIVPGWTDGLDEINLRSDVVLASDHQHQQGRHAHHTSADTMGIMIIVFIVIIRARPQP